MVNLGDRFQVPDSSILVNGLVVVIDGAVIHCHIVEIQGFGMTGMLLAGLASPKFTEYAINNMREGAAKVGRTLPDDFPVGGVILAACNEDGAKAKAATRAYTGTYVVNKLRNIKNDVILAGSGLPPETWGRPRG